MASSQNMFSAYREMQPNPLRSTVQEVSISKKHKVDHLLAIGLNQIEIVKHLFTKSFIHKNEQETARERQKAIEKAQIMIKESKLYQKELEERERAIVFRNATHKNQS